MRTLLALLLLSTTSYGATLGGYVTITKDWEWVIIKNPTGNHSSNTGHDFNDSCGVSKGGKLRCIAIETNRVLVEYTAPKDALGTECSTGAIYWLPEAVWDQMEISDWQRAKEAIEARKRIENEKAHIRALLEKRKALGI